MTGSPGGAVGTRPAGLTDDLADVETAVDLADARGLLYDLVATPSPSGEEADAAAVLADYLGEHGREVAIDAVGNVRAPADDGVLLTSHVDTVPGDVPVRVDAGVLHGRGTVDATGPLAAMAAAAVATGASFAGVVREETDSAGARQLVEDREAPDAVINGEPSGWNGITLGYRGLLAGTYTAETAAGHTSRPEPNAVQHAIDWWSAVESAVGGAPPVGADGGNEAADDAESDGEPPVFEQVTATPVAVDGGFAADGLSVTAELDAQLRVPPAETPASLRAAAEAELAAAGAVEWTEAIEPVMASPRSPVARALRGAIRARGAEPRLLRKTGTSDMNVFAGAWDCPMATYGPGDSELDHAPDERIALDEFDRAVAVLERTADRLLA